MFLRITTAALLISSAAFAANTKTEKADYLVKLAPGHELSFMQTFSSGDSVKVEKISDEWVEVKGSKAQLMGLQNHRAVEYVQPNYPIHLMEDYQIQDSLRRAAVAKLAGKVRMSVPADNPAIPAIPAQGSGKDPLTDKQWGMKDIGVADAWNVTKGNPDMIVAVIDTGVEYTHEDLNPNIWRNAGEIGTDANGKDKSSNGIDDDKNGYVDDVIGWDFVSNDNKPFDLAVDPIQLLAGGGNPGHGTHCAGNVAARSDNGKGVAGVAPNVKIMPLRFISEKGAGTTADAIKAIRYAVDNGAKVMSNSWGSEGEDPSDATENKALRDAVQYAQDKGVLFIAAAGNGHKGVGYDNDKDKLPGYPASYDHDIIISVAALDSKDALGSFSNWGTKSVDIGAPGVVVYSTVVGNGYSDVVIDKYGFHVTWDGTSMATPHVAGAAALYWSAHPEKNWRDVKAAILGSAKKISALANKSVSGGKLDVRELLKQ